MTRIPQVWLKHGFSSKNMHRFPFDELQPVKKALRFVSKWREILRTTLQKTINACEFEAWRIGEKSLQMCLEHEHNPSATL